MTPPDNPNPNDPSDPNERQLWEALEQPDTGEQQEQPPAYPASEQPPAAYPPPSDQPGAYPPPPATADGQVAPGEQGEPEEQPQQSNVARIVLAVLVVVALVLAGTWYFVSRASNPDNAKAGDCIQYSSSSDVNVVDCDSDDALYKVQERVDGTSSRSACDEVVDSDVVLFTEGDDDQYTLCVSLVLTKGDCVSTDGDVVPCTDPTAQYEVASVLKDTTDESGCSSDTELSRVYESDNRVVCLSSTS